MSAANRAEQSLDVERWLRGALGESASPPQSSQQHVRGRCPHQACPTEKLSCAKGSSALIPSIWLLQRTNKRVYSLAVFYVGGRLSFSLFFFGSKFAKENGRHSRDSVSEITVVGVGSIRDMVSRLILDLCLLERALLEREGWPTCERFTPRYHMHSASVS